MIIVRAFGDPKNKYSFLFSTVRRLMESLQALFKVLDEVNCFAGLGITLTFAKKL